MKASSSEDWERRPTDRGRSVRGGRNSERHLFRRITFTLLILLAMAGLSACGFRPVQTMDLESRFSGESEAVGSESEGSDSASTRTAHPDETMSTLRQAEGEDVSASDAMPHRQSAEPLLLRLAVDDRWWNLHFDDLLPMEEQLSAEGGRLRAEVNPASFLGGAEALLRKGAAGPEMLLVEAGAFTECLPEMGEPSSLLRFESLEEARARMESELQRKIEARLPELVGWRVLGHTDRGFRWLTTDGSDPFDPAVATTMRMAVLDDEAGYGLAEAFGAEAASLPESELYASLQLGLIQAQEHGLPAIDKLRLGEVQSLLIETRHSYSPLCLVIREECWQSLTTEEQTRLSAICNSLLENDRANVDAETEMILMRLESSGMRILRWTDYIDHER